MSQNCLLPKIFSFSFQSRTSQTRLSCGTNQIGLVHIPAPHKHFLLYQHFYTESEHPHKRITQRSCYYQSVTMTAWRIQSDENCATVLLYKQCNSIKTFCRQLIGPNSKGINSWPLTSGQLTRPNFKGQDSWPLTFQHNLSLPSLDSWRW